MRLPASKRPLKCLKVKALQEEIEEVLKRRRVIILMMITATRYTQALLLEEIR